METTELLHSIVAAAASILAAAGFAASTSVDPPLDTVPASTRSIEIPYVAHDGHESRATVLLPDWYGAGDNPPIPLVISPHGRGLNGEKNSRLWGDLPGRGGFAVVNPDGRGAHLRGRFSWGAAGQIEDLARMPEILEAALPWLHVDRTRIYALGGSMGGQETLLLVARHGDLLAGAVAVDPMVDFARQYASFHRFHCDKICRSHWGGFIGDSLQRFARREVGGSPDDAAQAFAARSPLTYAAEIAKSGVPLQVWWSRNDQVILDSELHSGLLVRELRAVDGHAPLHEVVGEWRHTHPLRYDRALPRMLAGLGLAVAQDTGA